MFSFPWVCAWQPMNSSFLAEGHPFPFFCLHWRPDVESAKRKREISSVWKSCWVQAAVPYRRTCTEIAICCIYTRYTVTHMHLDIVFTCIDVMLYVFLLSWFVIPPSFKVLPNSSVGSVPTSFTFLLKSLGIYLNVAKTHLPSYVHKNILWSFRLINM